MWGSSVVHGRREKHPHRRGGGVKTPRRVGCLSDKFQRQIQKKEKKEGGGGEGGERREEDADEAITNVRRAGVCSREGGGGSGEGKQHATHAPLICGRTSSTNRTLEEA